MFNFLLKNNISIGFFCLVFVCSSIYTIATIGDQKSFWDKNIRIASYESQQSRPVEALNISTPSTIEEANISFEFMNNDTSFSYGNLFQTSSNPDGIRLEFQPNNKLFLILGGDKLHLIANDLNAYQRYQINISYKRGKEFVVRLNDRKPLLLDFPIMGSEKLQASTFLIGTGLSQTRSFQGSISNFNASIRIQKTTTLVRIFTGALVPISFSMFLLGAIYRSLKN